MKRPNRPLMLLAGWLCLIFVTSCFLVPLPTLVRSLQGLSGSADFQQGVRRFWVADWFFVVKGWHMTEYAVLFSLAVAALRRGNVGGPAGRIGMSLALAVAFAATDEWHQTFVPGRDGCVRDVLIDTGGALLAAIGWSARLWLDRRRPSPQEAASRGA